MTGNFSSNHEIDFSDSLDIYEFHGDKITSLFMTDGINIFGANLVSKNNNKYDLYKSIIKTKNISLGKTTITRPTIGAKDDARYRTDPDTHYITHTQYAAVGEDFFINSGPRASIWTGRYTMNIILKDIPYIKDISPQMNLTNETLLVNLVDCPLNEKTIIKIPSIKLYKNILQTSTAGIFPDKIYGLKGENMYNDAWENLTLDSIDVKNIKTSLNYNNRIGLLYPEDKGSSNAIWVVLWRY